MSIVVVCQQVTVPNQRLDAITKFWIQGGVERVGVVFEVVFVFYEIQEPLVMNFLLVQEIAKKKLIINEAEEKKRF
jgi:hypothetical protein